MALRLNSLKARMALMTAGIVAVILGADAAYLYVTRRTELRRDLEDRADTFAMLSRQPICEGYATYYNSGFYKFKGLMTDYLRSEPNLEAIQIVTVGGEIVFDSGDLGDAAPHPPGSQPRVLRDAAGLEAARKMEPTHLAALDATGAPALEIVAPYMADWGRRRLTVVYRFHYRNLPGRMAGAPKAAGVLLLSILAAAVAMLSLVPRSTQTEAVPREG
jgi:hypothetical protein